MKFYTKELDKLYSELLDSFLSLKRPSQDKEYCIQYPTIGTHFIKTGLMVYGRSLNGGFGAKWSIPEISKKKEKIIKEAKSLYKNQWELDDINEKARTKPFFRITKKLLVDHYKIPENKYPTHFIWSNLMKIAPESKGNPTDSEFYAQVEICTDIFKYELDVLKPKNVILFAGAIVGDNNWAYDFIEKLKCKPMTKESKTPIVATYNYKQTRIIHVIRPEMKPSEYTEDMLVKDIVKKLKK